MCKNYNFILYYLESSVNNESDFIDSENTFNKEISDEENNKFSTYVTNLTKSHNGQNTCNTVWKYIFLYVHNFI